MEQKKFRFGPIRFTPAAYGSDETKQIFSAPAGTMIHEVFVNTHVAFDGTGGRTVSLGDSGDTDRLSATSDSDITTAGNLAQGLGGSGSVYLALGRHLYTSATAVNLYFTAATGGSPTVGALSVWGFYSRVRP